MALPKVSGRAGSILFGMLYAYAAMADPVTPTDTGAAGNLAAQYDQIGSTATNVADGFTLVAVGDLIVSRELSKFQGDGFTALTKVLRNGDATFGNIETNIFDSRNFNGSPQAEYGGAYHVSTPALAPDLKAMGFNLLGRANNHALDWGLEGMRETSRALDGAGIIYAGVGENLSQAGAARFLETRRGRVALVSFASSFTKLSRAADPAAEAPGRPGLNALRLARSVTVTAPMLADLRRIRDALPGPRSAGDDASQVDLNGTTYKLGARVDVTYRPNPEDVSNILRNVRRGKQFSDFLIATNHGHEPGNWSQEPPDYAQSFAHQLIDAGADAYIVHGPHQLRGIEIYKRRPIFYSLGNFIMDDLRTPVGADMFAERNKDPRTMTDADVTASEMAGGYGDDDPGFDNVPGFAHPVFYESVIAVSRFDHNRLAEVRLYPIELSRTSRFADRGVPRPVTGTQARAILERLQRLSNQYGTRIAIEKDVGVIKIP